MLSKTHDTDMTVYYSDSPQIMLSWFSADERWCLRFKFLDRYEGISATLVRNLINANFEVARKFVPNFVYIHLEEIAKYLKEAE